MSDVPCLKVRELFWLNEHIPYVVVSGWEHLNGGVKRELEIVALDRKEFVKAWGLEKDKDFPEAHQTIYSRCFDRKKWRFNVHAIEDNFWSSVDTERILKGRVKDQDYQIYLIHPTDEFWSILFHATYHLTTLDLDTQVKLSKFRPSDFTEQISDRQYSHKWLVQRGFFPVRCKDQSVGYYVPGEEGK